MKHETDEFKDNSNFYLKKYQFSQSVNYNNSINLPHINPKSRDQCSPACEMNVHKRCERFVPPLCGVNARELGELLGKLGTSSHNLSNHSNKKMVCTPVCTIVVFSLFSVRLSVIFSVSL